jgi:hypothetical protein
MHLGLRACRPLSHNITENNRLPSKKKFVITFDLGLAPMLGMVFSEFYLLNFLKKFQHHLGAS